MLHRAMKRVIRYAPRGALSQERYRAIRWIPAGQLPHLRHPRNEGTWLVAYDGTVGVAQYVEEDLPDTLVPLDGLSQAVSSEFVSVDDQGRSLAITTSNGGVYQIPKLPTDGYALPPVASQWQPWPIWHQVTAIAHCVAGPKSHQPAFQHVCLRPSGVEATDTICAALTPGWGWESQVLVPAKLLDGKDVKGAPIELAVNEHHAVLSLGPTEYRWGMVRRDLSFPDFRAVAQNLTIAGTVVLPVQALQAAVKQAVSISAANTVALTFDSQCLGLLGWRGTGAAAEHAFDVTLPLAGGQPAADTVTVYVDGKLLLRSLRAATTPAVEIAYGGPHDPIRIVSGMVLEMISPWML